MPQIVLVSDNISTVNEVERIVSANSYSIKVLQTEEAIENAIKNDEIDVLLFDSNSESLDIISIVRNTKLSLQTKDVRSILLLSEKEINYDILRYTNAYIIRPFNEKLFLTTLNSNLQLKDTFRVLSKNNNDLAKSLYQLNVLYNTSTQLAGSLDKTKLIEIMTDGLDQSLSLSLTYALILNEVNDIQLIIKSLFPISQRLENAIKLRALLNFKNLFSINPSIVETPSPVTFGLCFAYITIGFPFSTITLYSLSIST